jgi:hypothetical protein
MEPIWANVFPFEIFGSIGNLFFVSPINIITHTTNGVLEHLFVSVFTLAQKNEAEPALNRYLMHQLTEQYLPHRLTMVE